MSDPTSPPDPPSRPEPARPSRLAAAGGSVVGMFTSPLRSKLFMIAVLATVAAGGALAWTSLKGDPSPGPWAPWCLRLGISFIAAFVFAYLLRRAIIAAVFIGGALIGIAVLLNKLGLGLSREQLDSIDEQVRSGTEAVRTGAESMWQTVKPHLPSGAAAGFGLFRGALHKHSA